MKKITSMLVLLAFASIAWAAVAEAASNPKEGN
jgi:hypothetical protein